MAETRSKGADSFVDALVKDPKKVPAVRTLAGFEGKASDAKHVRLYSDANLTSYVEVEADDVLHRQDLPASESPLGGVVVWVKATAPVKSPAASGFLAGGIASGNLGNAMPNPDGDPLPTPITPVAMGLRVTPVVRAEAAVPAAFLRGGIAQAHLAGAANVADLAAQVQIRKSWIDGCRSVMIECPATGGTIGTIGPRTSWIDGCPSALIDCGTGGRTGGTIGPRTSWIDGCRSALVECEAGGGGIRFSVDAGCRVSLVAGGCVTAPTDPTIYYAGRELAAWRAARGW